MNNAEILTECWQTLVEYIPRREQKAAADHLISYLVTVLDKDELTALSDSDEYLSTAYHAHLEESEEYSEDEDSYDDQDD